MGRVHPRGIAENICRREQNYISHSVVGIYRKGVYKIREPHRLWARIVWWQLFNHKNRGCHSAMASRYIRLYKLFQLFNRWNRKIIKKKVSGAEQPITLRSIAESIFTTVYNTYSQTPHTTFPIRNSEEFQMYIRKNGQVFVCFSAWIDKRFLEGGEVCLFLSHSAPSLQKHFNGTVCLSGQRIIVNNFGFFRGEKTSIEFLNEDSLLGSLCSELQSWSESTYDWLYWGEDKPITHNL